MNAKKVAGLAGISVRMLHHYDEIGLLSPVRNTENRYREYTEEDLDRLQQILFFRECGFPLARIRELLQDPAFNRAEAFELQRKYLLYEKQRIETMLDTLDRSLRSLKGDAPMSQDEKFRGFDMSHNPYEEEARQRWGDETVDRSNAFLNSKTPDEKESIAQGMDALFTELAALRGEDPASDLAQKAMEKMFRYFNQNFGVQYTLEAFAGLGQMYIADERFTQNIDRYGQGLSRFLAEAMGIFAQRQTQKK